MIVRSTLAILFVVVTSASCRAADPRDALIAGVDRYAATVDSLLGVVVTTRVPDSSRCDRIDTELYLQSCLDLARTIDAWTRLAPRPDEELTPPDVRRHLARRGRRAPEDFDRPFVAMLRAERASYVASVEPRLAGRALAGLDARRKLLAIRAYDDEGKERGNFVERWLGRNLPFLRFDDSDPWYRSHGVSRLEASFRTEPLVAFQGESNPGAILGLGLLLNHFPRVVPDPEEPAAVRLEPTWTSRWVHRWGPKIGFGLSLDENDDPEILWGGGIQFRQVTVWLLDTPDRDGAQWAVSLSGLSWLVGVLRPFVAGF